MFPSARQLTIRSVRGYIRRSCDPPRIRTAATTAARSDAGDAGKQEGDISNAFASLSGQDWKPLEPRFAELKKRLVRGHEDVLQASWQRLLQALSHEIPTIQSLGSAVIPEVDFTKIEKCPTEFSASLKHRGVAVIRNVLPRDQALALKSDLISYLAANPSTKAFPPTNPQVYELYWSRAQMQARLHPNMIATHRFLMSHWHSADPAAAVSVDHPLSYADRLRMRQPGDNKFALGPHVDGGSCERWEEGGYGRGGVYDKVFQGRWEEFDPWEVSCRLPVVSDLYGGSSACSVFRCFQGWLSMSDTGPFEGTLLVNPLLGLATSYYLLRPFFAPKQAAPTLTAASMSSGSAPHFHADTSAFLDPANWHLVDTASQDSWLHGATPGHGQELRDELHPHLRLKTSMVHAPKVAPGDYVAWHCDTVHAVDSVHAGDKDSSVLYIPASPLTESNAKYTARQRECFLQGRPGPDFPGGVGEGRHVGRVMAEEVLSWTEPEQGYTRDSVRAWGLEEFDGDEAGLSAGQKEVIDRANKVLGFYD